MHPTVALGIALSTWLVLKSRSVTSCLLFAVAAFVMGWEPASHGSRLGVFLVAVSAGAAVPATWNVLLAVLDVLRRGGLGFLRGPHLTRPDAGHSGDRAIRASHSGATDPHIVINVWVKPGATRQ